MAKERIKSQFVIASMTITMLLSAFVTVGCTKDKEAEPTRPTPSKVKAQTSNLIYLGYYNGDSFVYSFNMEELIDKFGLFVDSTDTEYVLESFEILDTLPTTIYSKAEIKIVFYNITDECTETLWVPAEKNEEGYYLDKATNNHPIGDYIRCKANRKCSNSCSRVYDEKGHFIGCKCTGGKCKERGSVAGMLAALADVIQGIKH